MATPMLVSLSQVSCSLQTSIDNKGIPARCKNVRNVRISNSYQVVTGYSPSLFIVELGHLTELNCNLMAKDIDESLNIRHNEGTLNYKLVGFTHGQSFQLDYPSK